MVAEAKSFCARRVDRRSPGTCLAESSASSVTLKRIVEHHCTAAAQLGSRSFDVVADSAFRPAIDSGSSGASSGLPAPYFAGWGQATCDQSGMVLPAIAWTGALN